jgi:predicted Zn finger-like uncharacterized protein
MIISCSNCNKKFDIDEGLIPNKGRLLQCNNCNHKWFFQKKIIKENASNATANKPSEELGYLNKDLKPFNKEIQTTKAESPMDMALLDSQPKDSVPINESSIEDKTDKKKGKIDDNNLKIIKFNEKKNYNILSLTIVFIISFIALIIFLDTFQKPIKNIIPNIEFILYSLYNTLHDIILFFSDLI